MPRRGKLNIFTMSSIIVTIISFVLGINRLTASYSATKVVVENFSYELRDVSDIIYSDRMIINNNPVIDNHSIQFKVAFTGKDDYYQFFFDLRNMAAIEGVVKDVRIEGLEKEDKVRISIIGIKKGDIIESSRYVDNIKVVVECLDDYYDDEGIHQPIIEDIKITIDVNEKG